MKKSMVFLVVLVFVSMSVVSFGAGVNVGNSYHWDQWTQATINDWTKVGSAGYETHFNLVSNVDNPLDTLNPYVANNDTWLRIEGTDDLVPRMMPADTWAGYEWSIPDGVNEEVISAWLPGYFNFLTGSMEIRLTDTSGNVLWSASPTAGWVDLTTSTFEGVDTIRLIAYATVAHNIWGSGNFLYANPIYLNTETVPEPVTMALMALGSLVFIKRKK